MNKTQYTYLLETAINSISKDKIKAKIEEYKETLKKCNKAQDIDRIKALNERILFGEELLEE